VCLGSRPITWLALAADDGVRGRDQERPTELAAKQPGRRPYLPPGGVGKLQAMARPVYGIDLITLTAAVVLAAGIVALAAKNKCLADRNKPHTEDKANQHALHPWVRCVVQIGAASAKLLRWRGPIILEPKRGQPILRR
jgi:hypothetical protein